MTTRDELAAVECHKIAIQAAIQRAERARTPCSECGIVDLLRVELWKLDHPVVQRPMSKTAAGIFSAIGGGIGYALAKTFGL